MQVSQRGRDYNGDLSLRDTGTLTYAIVRFRRQSLEPVAAAKIYRSKYHCFKVISKGCRVKAKLRPKSKI